MQSTTILIVEDDNDINNLLDRILRNRHYRTIQAFTGAEAQQAPAADLVIIDQNLPDTTGIELARHFRRRGIPFIFMTSESGDDVITRAIKAGALAYLTKPAQTQQVIAAVHAALARASDLTQLITKIEETAILSTAEGILSARKNITTTAAAAHLDHLSNTSRKPKIDIARRIIRSNDLLNENL